MPSGRPGVGADAVGLDQRQRTLTSAPLDRDADLDRDYAAVATPLHYDAGLPADQALARARETFRAGETVRDWWGRAAASPAAKGATCDTRPAMTDLPHGAQRDGTGGSGSGEGPVVNELPPGTHRRGGRPGRRRRLSDVILAAAHLACDQGELEIAEHLLAIVEFMLRRGPPEGRPERRLEAQPLVAAHERLWTLRHHGAPND